MDLIKLTIIFILIIIPMKFKKPLNIAISVGIVGTIILYRVNVIQAFQIALKTTFSYTILTLILAFYSITFLQRMLEKRGHLLLAEKSLNGLFNSRRINAMIAPFIIGLLPSPGAVIIAAPIVDNAGGNDISKEDKTFITSYYRHISEGFLPTYTTIILALQLSGVNTTDFVLAMLPMVLALFLIGYLFYVHKIPKETEIVQPSNKGEDAINLIRSLWTIALAIIIILTFNFSVYLAVTPVILLSFFINKFTLKEIAPMFLSAFETKIVLNTIVIMIFKDILTYVGVINRLPDAFSGLPIPTVVIFALVFFFGALVAGGQAITALGIPLAFAAIPNGGLALMILLMCVVYISMQVSPAHLCLAIVTETFHTSYLDLVKRTIPVMIWFILISSAYSYLLALLQ